MSLKRGMGCGEKIVKTVRKIKIIFKSLLFLTQANKNHLTHLLQKSFTLFNYQGKFRSEIMRLLAEMMSFVVQKNKKKQLILVRFTTLL